MAVEIAKDKANSGFIDGLLSSKKLGLTATFVTSCFAILPTLATEFLQATVVLAAVLAVVGYLVSQALVERAWGPAKVVEAESEKPCLEPQASTTTTTMASG